jgi:hypothetical protein
VVGSRRYDDFKILRNLFRGSTGCIDPLRAEDNTNESWPGHPLSGAPLRAAVGCIAILALLAGCSRQQSSPGASNDRPSVAVSPSPITKPAVPPHRNSVEMLAHCQPELGETPSAPTFEVGEKYNRVAVQLKVRFVVDGNGFVVNPYVSGGTVVTPADQEAAIDYVRHLTFETPTAEECQTVKMQMVGNFHMSKDSSGDWITIFDAHPVYSFSGSQVVVNPN